jgi:hypothetical protein
MIAIVANQVHWVVNMYGDMSFTKSLAGESVNDMLFTDVTHLRVAGFCVPSKSGLARRVGFA